ncbi:MAG TPA: DUF6062 family protein [Bacillota bacterium]
MIDKHNLFYEMQEGLSQTGCPVCLLTRKALDSFAESILDEKISDHGFRDALVKSRGFCPKHAWRLQAEGNPLAHTLIYVHFLEELLLAGGCLPEIGDEPGDSAVPRDMKAVLKKLRAEAACPLCVYQEELEERYVRSLLNFLQDPGFSAKYAASSGVCRPHFLRIQKMFCPRDIKRLIIKVFFASAQALFLELEEIKRKADYRFATEAAGTERDAWVRVIGFWNGTL